MYERGSFSCCLLSFSCCLLTGGDVGNDESRSWGDVPGRERGGWDLSHSRGSGLDTNMSDLSIVKERAEHTGALQLGYVSSFG